MMQLVINFSLVRRMLCQGRFLLRIIYNDSPAAARIHSLYITYICTLNKISNKAWAYHNICYANNEPLH